MSENDNKGNSDENKTVPIETDSDNEFRDESTQTRTMPMRPKDMRKIDAERTGIFAAPQEEKTDPVVELYETIQASKKPESEKDETPIADDSWTTQFFEYIQSSDRSHASWLISLGIVAGVVFLAYQLLEFDLDQIDQSTKTAHETQSTTESVKTSSPPSESAAEKAPSRPRLSQPRVSKPSFPSSIEPTTPDRPSVQERASDRPANASNPRDNQGRVAPSPRLRRVQERLDEVGDRDARRTRTENSRRESINDRNDYDSYPEPANQEDPYFPDEEPPRPYDDTDAPPPDGFESDYPPEEDLPLEQDEYVDDYQEDW